MPIEIKIHTFFDPERSERAQLEASLEALGFVRQVTFPKDFFRVPPVSEDAIKEAMDRASSQVLHQGNEALDPPADIIAEQQADVEQAKAASRRERGKPGEGRARRTKAEIAEDEAADAADEAVAAELSRTSGQAQISTGEERVSPDDVQDAADEADETASASDGTLTHDDLRRALGTLGIKAGVAAVKEGGLLGMTVDKVPTDQIGAMIAKIEAAKAGSETAPVEDKPAEAAPSYPATKAGLMSAMLAYALKYDGTNDVAKASMATMPATMTDAPKVFAMRFGEDVNSISKVPADGYEQAVKDIIEATEKNPFNREVK